MNKSTTITLVTGNPNKLREIQAMLPKGFKLVAQQVDLAEIQSLDLREIIDHKARSAYELVGSPVIVEDVSAGLDDLGSLPGPFYKFFRQEMGDEILLKLAQVAGSNKVTIRCMAVYYDGLEFIYGPGEIHGQVVEGRGENGFGFDPFVMPEGSNLTMAEMEPAAKNAISHRGRAFKSLFAQLKK